MIDTPSALAQLGPTQRALMTALQRNGEGLAVDDLVQHLGITANAVRQHLSTLEKDGWVQRQPTPATRGRPSFAYTLSHKGQEAFPRRYADLAASLIAELSEVLGPKELGETMQRMGVRAARELAPSQGNALAPAAIAQAMHAAGYDAQIDLSEAHHAKVVAHNCVFHKLAERHPVVCEFDLAFLGEASGQTITHRECIIKGGAVCCFSWPLAPVDARKTPR